MHSKWCPDCKLLLVVTAFNSDRRRKDGLSFYCRTCARSRLRASQDKHRGGPPTRRHPRDIHVPEGSKWCPDCQQILPAGDFPRNRAQVSGVHAYCKPCHRARGRASLAKVGGSRTYHLKRRYGITAADADRMLTEQGGVAVSIATEVWGNSVTTSLSSLSSSKPSTT